MCVSVCLPLRLVITSGVMWRDMNSIWLVKKFYRFCMVAIVGIVSRCSLAIEVHHRKQPTKRKLALIKPLLHCYTQLKQLYISN